MNNKRKLSELDEPFDGLFEVSLNSLDSVEDCVSMEVVKDRGVMARFEPGKLIGKRRDALALAIESGIVGRTAHMSRTDGEALVYMSRAIGISYQLPFVEFTPMVSPTMAQPVPYSMTLPGTIPANYVEETLALIKMYPSGDRARTEISMFPPSVYFSGVPSPMIGLDSFRSHITNFIDRRRNQETVTALLHAVREGIPFRLNTNLTKSPNRAGE